jgi:tRNA threonylcarbamoyladenosine biosynthesis protein TsaB
VKLLAIDTSTEACTVALLVDDAVEERFEIAPREHARLVLPMVETLLAEAAISITGLDGIALGRGPGSFTGVRIAAGVVQGIAFGAGLPVVPVSTLAVMAQGVFRESGAGNILPAIDARMNEVYWGCYEINEGIARSICRDSVVSPHGVEVPEGGIWVGAGTGWVTHKVELEGRIGRKLESNIGRYLPHAQDLAILGADLLTQGKSVLPEQVQPVYLRDKVASTK